MVRHDYRRAAVGVVLGVEKVVDVLVADGLRAGERDVRVDLLHRLADGVEARDVALAACVVLWEKILKD